MVFQLSMVDWQEGTFVLGKCVFWYMLNLFGVVVLPRCMVNWGKGGLGICAIFYM